MKSNVVHFIGLVIVFFMLSSMVIATLVFLASMIPYLVVLAAFVLPIMGTYNEKSEEGKQASQVSALLKKLHSVSKPLTKASYTVLGFSLLISIPAVLKELTSSMGLMAGGLLIAFLVWEGMRVIQKQTKREAFPNFIIALKKSW